ncbi:MAG: putative DNA-binding domain-containing protein [Pseudorhodoplanes sp.]|uniref:HvfC/BufC family peptide modification chaperone n=1 Tax=Pseudorhodoplanes sp. TaxID=1934341 RepID=UPI003D0EEF8E
MTSLAMLQDRFQRGLLEGDDGTLSDIADGARETRDALFGVYRNAYEARLVEVVEHDFEKLLQYMGGEAFDVMARAYVSATPSYHSSARWYSQALPDFLKTAAPWREAPELADLAAVERALNDAFDAADAAVLTLDALAAIPPSEWSALRFRPQPGAERIDLQTNAAAIWIALNEQRTPPAAEQTAAAVHLLVWRQDLIPKFREISDEEAMMWHEAAAGIPFGVLCEMLSFRSDPDNAPLRAATLLHGWIASGLISAVH